MDFAAVRLLFDAGLFVLIWMIQLLIYPSFLYYSNANLHSWHNLYTRRLSFIVIPLMLGQLTLAVIQLVYNATTENIVMLLLILAIWISTFLQFVPIHNSIAKNNINKFILQQLVNRNWLRTILWTIILFWNIYATLLV